MESDDNEDIKPDMEIDHEEDEEEDEDVKPDLEDLKRSIKLESQETVKVSKPGIIYLSTIPPGMNVKQIREYFTQFGEIHRSYLQPEKTGWKGKKRNLTFKEGWIEFRKRRHARRVAQDLNNTPVGGKKRKIYHDFLWNIKYLQGFQWTHLNERLAYERISMKQKLRAEISATKREVNFFAKSVDMSKKLKRKGLLNNPKGNESQDDNSKIDLAALQKADSGRKNSGLTEDRRKFLQSFFSK